MAGRRVVGPYFLENSTAALSFIEPFYESCMVLLKIP
jgi:hypothetical protein